MKVENNSLYRVSKLVSTAEGFRATVDWLSGHPVYHGHFPERAVVPGVLTLALVRSCAEAVIGHKVAYAGIKECKFLSTLLPDDEPTITLDFALDGNSQLSGTVRRGPDLVLKLKATLK